MSLPCHRPRRCPDTATSIVLAFPLLLLLSSSSASAQPVANLPVNADTGTVNQIGTIQITEAAGGQIFDATFGFGPGFAYLEDWYDFRWINIVVEYRVGGVPLPTAPGLGTVPAIDPAPTGQPYDTPFYNNEDAWKGGAGSKQARDPGVRSSLVDQPGGHPTDTVIVFDSYLVVQDESSGFFSDSMCVLAAFRWTYTQVSAGSPGVVNYVSTVPAATAPISTALANNTGYPVSFTPITGCLLLICSSGGFDCPATPHPSDPLPPLPGPGTLTLSGGTTCTASAPSVPLAGISWSGSDTSVPISGTVSLFYEETADPDVISVDMTARSLTIPPILLEGQTVDLLSSTLLSDGVHYHRGEASPNLYGAYQMEFNFLVNGAPTTLTQHGWLSADYDEFTGQWTDLTFGGAFDNPPPTGVPLLPTLGVVALLAMSGGLAWSMARGRARADESDHETA